MNELIIGFLAFAAGIGFGMSLQWRRNEGYMTTNGGKGEIVGYWDDDDLDDDWDSDQFDVDEALVTARTGGTE